MSDHGRAREALCYFLSWREKETEITKKKRFPLGRSCLLTSLQLLKKKRLFHSLPDIENLRRRRDAADAALRADEAERAALQREAAALTRRLGELGERVAAAARARDECADVLATAEGAYEKILQSAQSLRDVLKAEASEIGGGRDNGGGDNGREGSSSDSGNNSAG